MKKKTIEKFDGFQVLEDSELERVNAGGPGQYTSDNGGNGGSPPPPPNPSGGAAVGSQYNSSTY